MAVMHMQIHSEVQTQAFHFYCDVRNLLKRNEKYPAWGTSQIFCQQYSNIHVTKINLDSLIILLD